MQISSNHLQAPYVWDRRRLCMVGQTQGRFVLAAAEKEDQVETGSDEQNAVQRL